MDITKVREALDEKRYISGIRGMSIIKTTTLENVKFILTDYERLLKKETPMKPIIDKNEIAICQSCDNQVFVDCDLFYCSTCGQKLDWSEEE